MLDTAVNEWRENRQTINGCGVLPNPKGMIASCPLLNFTTTTRALRASVASRQDIVPKASGGVIASSKKASNYTSAAVGAKEGGYLSHVAFAVLTVLYYTGEGKLPFVHELQERFGRCSPEGQNPFPRRRNSTRHLAHRGIHPQQGVRRGVSCLIRFTLGD